MSPALFVFLIILAIVMLTVMTLKLKIHPAIALFIMATIIGLSMGNSFVGTMGLIKKYFGSTLSGIGILIIFGAIIASGIQDTGAATSIANFFIKLFKGKRLELAPTLTGFIMSISVFGDIAIVLNAPISAILAKRKKISMSVMAPMLNVGLTLTHGLVPPTPGILAVALTLQADIGMVIFVGLICAIFSLITTYLIARPLLMRSEFIEPLPEFVEGVEPAPANADYNHLVIKEKNLPNALMAFIPLIIPAVMITVGSFGKMLFLETSVPHKVMTTIGDSTLALFCGIVATAIMIFNRKDKVVNSARTLEPSLPANPTFLEIVFGNWVTRALKIAIVPLIVTAMGGAMGGILRESTAITEIGALVAQSQFPKILIPFVVSSILMAVCGSMTIAAITAAALVQPMVAFLGISPVVASVAIGAGSMVFWHVNNSGFWIFCSLYNFNAKQGLKYFTTVNALGGVMAFICLCIINAIFPI